MCVKILPQVISFLSEWLDASTRVGLLTVSVEQLPGLDLPFGLKGKPDVAICTAASIREDIPWSGLRVVFELKKAVEER